MLVLPSVRTPSQLRRGRRPYKLRIYPLIWTAYKREWEPESGLGALRQALAVPSAHWNDDPSLQPPLGSFLIQMPRDAEIQSESAGQPMLGESKTRTGCSLRSCWRSSPEAAA